MASPNRCPAMEDLLSLNRCLLGSSASAKGIFLDGFSKIPSRIPSRNGKFPYKWRFWWENMFWTAFSYELERWLRVWRKWGTAKHHKASHGKVWLPKLQHCEFWWGYTSRPNWAPDLGKQAPLRKTTFPISQTFKIRASLFLPKLTPMSGSPEGWHRKTDSFWSYLLDMLQLDSLLLFIWVPKKVLSHRVAHPLCKLYAFVPCFKETSPDSSNFQDFCCNHLEMGHTYFPPKKIDLWFSSKYYRVCGLLHVEAMTKNCHDRARSTGTPTTLTCQVPMTSSC